MRLSLLNVTLAGWIILGSGSFVLAGEPENTAPGLRVELYDLGKMVHAIPQLAGGQLPNEVLIVETLDLGGAGQPFGSLQDNFMTVVTGLIHAEKSGAYEFTLASDDGGRLWIDSRVVIDHDGLHGPDPKHRTIVLQEGWHRLKVEHFEAGGGERLALVCIPFVGRSGGERAPLPPTAFRHDATKPKATAPGVKRIIPALRRGLPGDGTPIEGLHPGFANSGGVPMTPVKELQAWLTDGRLPRMDGRPGETVYVWLPTERGKDPFEGVVMIDGGHYKDHIIAWRLKGEEKRVVLDEAGEAKQGAAFRFGNVPTALFANPSVKTGVFANPSVESRPEAFEMHTVRAMSGGLEINFTAPLDARCGWEAESYYVEQWPFDVEKGLPPRRDGVRYPVHSASVSPDRKQVFLEIDDLRESHVVYLRLLPPCYAEDGERLWSTEAWYTLNRIPPDRPGTVRERPTPEPQNFLTPEEKAAGFKLLFDGKTTRGWQGYRKGHVIDGWEVKDGCLVRVGPGGDIATDGQYGDFELKLEWRIAPAGNSGIFYRVDDSVGPPWETGPEMQVLDNDEHADGKDPKTSAGSNYGLYAPFHDVTVPVGYFNRVRIVARGNHIEHWLNGEKVVEYELGSDDWRQRVTGSKFEAWPRYGTVPRGRIVLQDHGDPVWYRNIKIRELD
jgi:hypothetical protein